MAFTGIICSKIPFIVISLIPQLEATSVNGVGSQCRLDLPKWPQSPWYHLGSPQGSAAPGGLDGCADEKILVSQSVSAGPRAKTFCFQVEL